MYQFESNYPVFIHLETQFHFFFANSKILSKLQAKARPPLCNIAYEYWIIIIVSLKCIIWVRLPCIFSIQNPFLFISAMLIQKSCQITGRSLHCLHFRLRIIHNSMTFWSKANIFVIPEIGTFDMKHSFFISSTSLGLQDLFDFNY